MAEVIHGIEIRSMLCEHETLLSIDKARKMPGFEPEFSWRKGR